MNVNDLNVEGVYGFVKEKFGNHIASNFKDEEIDGRNLILLARSPDCLALLSRLGVKRINDILKFQELLGAMRADIGCSYVPQPTTSTISQNLKRSRVIDNKSPPLEETHNAHFDFQTFSPQANISSSSQPFDQSLHQAITSSTNNSSNSTSSLYSSVCATNYEGVSDRTLVNWQQKVIRNEVRRRWMDHELPTFRRMDTSNNEELDLFVDELLKIGVLSAMGKELIRKKVILIIRERRKYVKSKNQDPDEGDEHYQRQSPPTFVHCGEETQSDQEFEREFAEELDPTKKRFKTESVKD